jgi:hypothetical protein
MPNTVACAITDMLLRVARTERQPTIAISLEPGESIRQRRRGIYIQTVNETAIEIELEVYARPRWKEVVDAAVQEASPESPELQRLSADARVNLSTSLEALFSQSESHVPTESLLEQAIKIATRASPELGNLSPQIQTALLVNILKRLSKDERDIAIPIFSMQSAERLGERAIAATWALVGATGALVLATIALIIATA